jgi:hypothetical protein
VPDTPGRARRQLCVPAQWLNAFCNDWLLRGYKRTFSPFHHGVVTAYALKVGEAGQGDHRDPSFSAFGAVRYPIHEIPSGFSPITRNRNICSIRAFWARGFVPRRFAKNGHDL